MDDTTLIRKFFVNELFELLNRGPLAMRRRSNLM